MLNLFKGRLPDLETLTLSDVRLSDWRSVASGRLRHLDLQDSFDQEDAPTPYISFEDLSEVLRANPSLEVLRLDGIAISHPSEEDSRGQPPNPIHLINLRSIELTGLRNLSLIKIFQTVKAPFCSSWKLELWTDGSHGPQMITNGFSFFAPALSQHFTTASPPIGRIKFSIDPETVSLKITSLSPESHPFQMEISCFAALPLVEQFAALFTERNLRTAHIRSDVVVNLSLMSIEEASQTLHALDGCLRVSRIEVGLDNLDLTDRLITMLSSPAVDGEWPLPNLWSLSLRCSHNSQKLIRMIRARRLAARSAAIRLPSPQSELGRFALAPVRITRIHVSQRNARNRCEAWRVIEQLVGPGARINWKWKT